jgi:hypothetical protein
MNIQAEARGVFIPGVDGTQIRLAVGLDRGRMLCGIGVILALLGFAAWTAQSSPSTALVMALFTVPLAGGMWFMLKQDPAFLCAFVKETLDAEEGQLAPS